MREYWALFMFTALKQKSKHTWKRKYSQKRRGGARAAFCPRKQDWGFLQFCPVLSLVPPRMSH